MMTRALLILMAWLVIGAAPHAQQPVPVPPAPPASPAPEADVRVIRYGRPAIRIGQDYTLTPDAAVREAVVILGNATIEGRVDQNVVVVFGNARVTDTAVIDGSLVVVGGTVTASDNAQVNEDLVIVGGTLDAPSSFAPRNEYIVIGPGALGGQIDGLIPWLTRGLMWGRLIVPDVGWVWGMLAFFFLIYAALNAVFHRAVTTVTSTLVAKPLTAFAVGVLTLLLLGPVAFLLAVSVVGIAVIPFVLCALIVAWIIGKIAVGRWIGMQVVKESDHEDRLQSLRSFAIGFALICLAYMVPVLGIITWATIGVLGLGGAMLAFMSSYRRENPLPVRQTPPVPVATVPPVPPMPAPAALANETPQYEAPSFTPPPPLPPPVATGDTGELLSFPKASFFDRLAAFVLDLILFVFIFNVFALGRGSDEGFFFFLLLAYHIGFWTWKRTTLGGIILQLRIIRTDGERLRFVDALVRGLSSIFSAIVVGLGFLWILKDPDRQAWHDRIAGTYVVKVPRSYRL